MASSARSPRADSSLLVTANFARVNHLSVMLLTDVDDEALLLQMPDGHSCNGAVDLQTLAHHGRRDEFGLGDLLQHFVVGGLVKHHHVCKLLLDLALAPLLFP